MSRDRRLRALAKTAVTLPVVVALMAMPLLLVLLVLGLPVGFAIGIGVLLVLGSIDWLGAWLAVPVSALLTLTALGVLAQRVVVETRERPPGVIEEVTTHATADQRPELRETVRSVAQRLDTPVPTVLVAGPDAPPALSTGITPGTTTLVVSTRVLDTLSPTELEAVVAHELAHVANHDSTLKTLLVVPHRLFGMLGLAGLAYTQFLLPLVLPYYVVFCVARGSFERTRERAADRAAARVTGNPAALASALETLDSGGDERPDADARDTASSLSIVPLADEHAVRTDWNREPLFWSVQRPVRRVWNRFTARHPRTEDRVDELRAIEREQETT
ncbi:M48 family metallopeptidase [Halomarina salina]|uniref:M48 family metallopeptidase n=1 Tax=Halomarina salina TaxID=1872699 RepID=A0ABD5RJM8_9EURY